jgi:hypothetical protein
MKKQVLFVYPNYSTFVKNDYLLLKKRYRVLKKEVKPQKNLFGFVIQQVKLFFFLLKNILKTNIIFIWFADYHSFLPALLGKVFSKKVVIVVGGTDAAIVPEIDYGIFVKRNIRALITKYSLKLSDVILPVHKSLIKGVNYYVDKKGIKIGFLNFVGSVNAKIVELPTGFDSDKWRRKGVKKENTVLTVAIINDYRTFLLKGMDIFIDAARILEDTNFVIIGMSEDFYQKYVEKDKPSNLKVYSYIDNHLLVNYFAKAKVYCQLSLSEGLPNALCEAMLCECIPVGSDVNGIPYGIGDTGFVLKERNVEKASELIQKALDADLPQGLKAREYVIKTFSHEKREKILFELLER